LIEPAVPISVVAVLRICKRRNTQRQGKRTCRAIPRIDAGKQRIRSRQKLEIEKYTRALPKRSVST
jgi:hypothetical protein